MKSHRFLPLHFNKIFGGRLQLRIEFFTQIIFFGNAYNKFTKNNLIRNTEGDMKFKPLSNKKNPQNVVAFNCCYFGTS